MRIPFLTAALVLLALPFAAAPAAADMTPNVPSLLSREWAQYCTEFLDIETNSGFSATACDATENGRLPDGDIDVELLLKPTISLDDPATFAATTRLLLRLAQPRVKQGIAEDQLDTSRARERILLQQHVNSARNIAFHVLSDIVAKRTPVPPTPDEEAAAADPIPPLSPVTPPAPVPVNIVAPAASSNPPARFDIAVGDDIANLMQVHGRLGGGQCPDNANAACGYYHCDPAGNVEGSTCIGRTAQGVLDTINHMGDAAFRGKNVLLSSGLSNQTSDCSSGTSPILRAQLDRLLNDFGAARVLLTGMYTGFTTGVNPIDFNVVNLCARDTVDAHPNNHSNLLKFIGYGRSADQRSPQMLGPYFSLLEGALSTIGGTPAGGDATTANVPLCADGTVGPNCD